MVQEIIKEIEDGLDFLLHVFGLGYSTINVFFYNGSLFLRAYKIDSKEIAGKANENYHNSVTAEVSYGYKEVNISNSCIYVITDCIVLVVTR